jgi:protein O-GlcNAcase / histone acetyltransferase
MPTQKDSSFLTGVIEGFYGKPWTQSERFTLFDWMVDWGLNTYVYAPKDDLKHRAIWRETYNEQEAEDIGRLTRRCDERGLRFLYGLSPGLDLRYSNGSDTEAIKRRFEQLLEMGCQNFCLLFDDISDALDDRDLERWGTLASAQSAVTNEIFRWTRERAPTTRFLFCPTAYCSRMANRNLGGEGYLATVGRELLPEIDIFWTGPEIISREITLGHVNEMRSIFRRKPLIWDNLHANDYDGRRFFCGPYAGRPRELLEAVNGIFTNPNCEFELNYVPIRTLAEFVHGEEPWDCRAVYVRALEQWRPQFATVGRALELDELMQFTDCYYLPHEEGCLAKELYQEAEQLLSQPPAQWGERANDFRTRVSRLREVCSQLATLRNRSLFSALSRYIWELREEMDLLERAIAVNSAQPAAFNPFHSDSHLAGTYRGGLVASLQRLLRQRADGTFVPTHADARSPQALD